MQEYPNRKPTRIEEYDYSTAGAYFITVCTANREKLFWISAPTVSTIIGSMKRWVSRQVGKSIWQKSFYDHIIRNQQDYNAVWEYIENNPLKYAPKKSP